MEIGLNFLNIEYLFRLIYLVVTGQIFLSVAGGADQDYADTWRIIQIIGLLLSVLLIAGIVYLAMRIRELRAYEDEVLYSTIEKRKPQALATDRWEHIEELAAKDNPNDWRQAIIEADIMLDELITSAGYYGDTLGEKLKSIERGAFPKIQQAWDAHKVRNEIAHRGSDFVLTRTDLNRTLALYEEVFSEFYFIDDE